MCSQVNRENKGEIKFSNDACLYACVIFVLSTWESFFDQPQWMKGELILLIIS